jgi:uncharacterized protein YbjT (DUF2867 family)
MIISIVGARGFLGSHLINHLLNTTNHTIRAISRNASSIELPVIALKRVQLINADVFDEDAMTQALIGTDVAYYFVHLMGQKDRDFYYQESIAADRFSASIITSGVKRIIYMGGLGNDNEVLSAHLESRHNTGTILREHCPLVLEFRASMIIGEGSISFDIIKNLVHKLPFMTLPRWSISLTQPIALADALDYLTQAAIVKLPNHQIVEIGGPEVVSYKELYRIYANWSGRHPFMIRIPFLPEWLGGWWLDLFTPRNHARIGRVMVHSMSNSMVVTHDHASQLFPKIHPKTIRAALDDTTKNDTFS